MTNHYSHSAQPDEVQPLKTGQSHVASEGRSVSQVSHGVEPRGVHDQVFANFAKLIKNYQCHRCQKETVVREGWDPERGGTEGARRWMGQGGQEQYHHVDQSTLYYIYSISSDVTTNPLCFH